MLLILETYVCQDLRLVVFIVRLVLARNDDPVIFQVGGSRLLFDCFECLSSVYYSSFALIVKPDSFMFYRSVFAFGDGGLSN